MAKNGVESLVALNATNFRRIEGTLVHADDKIVEFKARKSGGRRVIQKPYPIEDVAAYGNDFIVVRVTGPLERRIFKPISGVAGRDKSTGWYEIDGIRVNPRFASIEADLGVEDSGGGAAKKAKKKKKG
jgi:hypothetical protein